MHGEQNIKNVSLKFMIRINNTKYVMLKPGVLLINTQRKIILPCNIFLCPVTSIFPSATCGMMLNSTEAYFSSTHVLSTNRMRA